VIVLTLQVVECLGTLNVELIPLLNGRHLLCNSQAVFVNTLYLNVFTKSKLPSIKRDLERQLEDVRVKFKYIYL